MNQNDEHTPTRSTALKIAAVYAAVGALWILCSGWVLHHFVRDAARAEALENVKGWFYVLVTATLLGWWLDRYFRQIRNATTLLRKSEARFATIFNDSPTAVVISRLRDGVFLNANESFAELCGYPRGEIIGQTAKQLRLWHSDNRELVLGDLREKGRVVFEMQGRNKDGDVGDLLATFQLIELDGEPCVLGTLQEVTERKKAEMALRESEERLRFSLDSCHIGAWDMSLADGTVIHSLEHARIFGHEQPPPDWTREKFLEQIVPDDRERVRDVIQRAGDKKSAFNFECRIRRADGEPRWIWAAGRPILNEDGQARRMAGIVQDITERKRMQLETEIQVEFLREANTSRTTRELVEMAVRFVQRHSGCEAVGIRLRQGEDFPYFEASGFPQKFLKLENSLCSLDEEGNVMRDADGNALLACMCGNVLRGRFDPGKSFFSGHGSFWANDTTRLLATTTAAERLARTRNRCNGEGYESVALIPLVSGDQRLGLLQLNDRRKGMFTPESIALWERLAGYLAVGLMKFQAEAALQRSETRLRLFIEHAPAALAMFDRDMRYLEVSRRWLSDYGLEGREILGRSHYEIFPEIGEELKSVHRRGLAGESMRAGNERFQRADGTVQHLRWEMHPWRDGGDGIGGIVIFTEDITERVRAEAALRDSEERFRSLIEGAPEAVFVQCGGVCRYINRAGVELLGAARAEDLLGRPFLDRIAPEYHDAVRERIRAQRDEAVVAQAMEQEYLRLDGTRVPVETSAVAIRFQNQDGHLVFVRDITARREAGKERTELEAQLRQAQKMESIGLLAGGVAHDFNNLLMGIMGYAELARDEIASDDPIRSRLDEITVCARRSAAITRQLLAFARKQTISPVAFDLNDHVTGMLKLLRRLLREDIELTWRPGGRDAWVKMDLPQIDQVMTNLVVNARDAIVGVGSLTIETGHAVFDADACAGHAGRVPGEYVRLSVGDSGCGMDRATLDRIFEPFFTTKEPGKGTGLGLSTVYGIVQQNHGFLEVDSEPGKGTTFRIYIPSLPPEAAERIAPAATPEASGGSETVLLVEDEKSVRITTGLFLQGLGYRVLSAAEPEEALRLANGYAGPIHLLVTDVVMPGMSGRDLYTRLAAIFPGMACLFVSGYSAEIIAKQGVLCDGVQFLAKPFTRKDLARKAREVLTARPNLEPSDPAAARPAPPTPNDGA